MKCPRCQHENPPQAKFCLECGARMVLTCPKCRSELPTGAKFCLECGAPVVSPATAERTFTTPETYTPAGSRLTGIGTPGQREHDKGW
jgi:ribosomal protein L40E